MTQRIIAVVLCLFAAFAGWDALAEGVPTTINHQGTVAVDGEPFTGTGQFRFALVSSGGLNNWTSDGSQMGTSEMPDTALSVSVTDGYYTVNLGESNAMNVHLFPATPDLVLRVWFDDGVNGVQQLTPDQPLTSVGYACYARQAENAQTLDGADSADFADASHTHNASEIETGTLPLDRYSAYSDLEDESRIGTDSWQLAAGDHTHSASDIDSGTLSNDRLPSTITVDEVEYDSPHSYRLIIPCAAFRPSRNVDYYLDSMIDVVTGTTSLYAPVILPPGSTITAFGAYMYKDTTAARDLTVTLKAFNEGGTSANSSMASVDSSGIGNETWAEYREDATVSDPNVASDRFYVVKVECTAWADGVQRLASVRITYEIDGAL